MNRPNQTKRAVVLSISAGAFLAAFLVIAGMSWQQVALAVGGAAFLALLLIAGIELQERIDGRRAAKVQARNRLIEADDRQRRIWEAKL